MEGIMDKQNLGNMIKKLRLKASLTQAELALKLNISDKTISKWESGLGYPDITQLPALSEIFGVSIDYLLKGNSKGITIAGNIIVDIVNTIDKYPKQSMLANILETEKAVGGCVSNTIIDISKIDPEVLLFAIGKIGDDENGRFVSSQIKQYGIDTSGIIVSDKYSTSCTNVMYDISTSERTFFYSKGANQDFSISDINIDKLDCEFFHIGYVFLLDALDADDEEYGTKLARLLHMVNSKGIKTSIDAISSDQEGYSKKTIPVLKYCSYTIMNETEGGLVTGINPRKEDGSIDVEKIRAILNKFIDYGVQEKAIIHSKEAGFMMTADREFIVVPSFNIPNEYIKGNLGAGDAFTAGCLYGLYSGYSDKEILEFASCAAAANLSAPDSISGMKSKDKLKAIENQFTRRELL